MATQKGPIGIELVRRGILRQSDINKALEYQRRNPEKRIIEIIDILHLCDEYILLQTLGEILNEKTMMLGYGDIDIDVKQYISIDMAKKYKAIPYQIENNRMKVCFADNSSDTAVESIRLILLNKGFTMDKYITFERNIRDVLNQLEGTDSENIDSTSDITTLVDNIIKNAMKKRASDVHIEPLEDSVRVRYRIDGELLKA